MKRDKHWSSRLIVPAVIVILSAIVGGLCLMAYTIAFYARF